LAHDGRTEIIADILSFLQRVRLTMIDQLL